MERLDPCILGLNENTSAPQHPARVAQSVARCFRTHCTPVSCSLGALASPGKRLMRRAAATLWGQLCQTILALARLRSGCRPAQAGACITDPLHNGLLPAQSGQAGRGTVERLDPCTLGFK